MEIFSHKIDENILLPNNFINLYPNLNYAFFDIETTGLNRKTSKIILIGILYVVDNQLILKQYFCNNKSEEKEMLLAFMSDIKKFDLLISYNGNSFDIPFINDRLRHNKICQELKPYKSVDFLPLVRRNKDFLGLSNYKLKSVEKLMDIHRNDTISGKDSVDLYNIYEETKDEKLLKVILLHNYDDLYFFSKTIKLLDLLPCDSLIVDFPYIIQTKSNNIYVTNFSIKGSHLFIEGSILWENIYDCSFYDKGLEFTFDAFTKNFLIKILLHRGVTNSNDKCLYLNLEENFNAQGNLIFKINKELQSNSILYFYKNFLEKLIRDYLR